MGGYCTTYRWESDPGSDGPEYTAMRDGVMTAVTEILGEPASGQREAETHTPGVSSHITFTYADGRVDIREGYTASYTGAPGFVSVTLSGLGERHALLREALEAAGFEHSDGS